jgi:hypothetical protein
MVEVVENNVSQTPFPFADVRGSGRGSCHQKQPELGPNILFWNKPNPLRGVMP